MAKKVYYEKRGNKYYPISEYDSDMVSSFDKGHHLVYVRPGISSYTRKIDPNYAAMIAAGNVAEDSIATALCDWFDTQPKTQELTERQLELWKELKASFESSEEFQVFRKTAVDIARQGIAAMQEEANKLLTYPAAKEAWDNFQLVAELTKTQNDS